MQPHRLINPAHQSHYIIPPCLQREPESHGNHKQGAHVCTHARTSTATRPSRGQELLQEHRRKTLLQPVVSQRPNHHGKSVQAYVAV